jgi:hypothetical protein
MHDLARALRHRTEIKSMLFGSMVQSHCAWRTRAFSSEVDTGSREENALINRLDALSDPSGSERRYGGAMR